MKIGRYETRGRTLVRVRPTVGLSLFAEKLFPGYVVECRLYDTKDKKWVWMPAASPARLATAKGYAAIFAKAVAPSELIVINKNGRISKDKRTYGADPRKTKG